MFGGRFELNRHLRTLASRAAGRLVLRETCVNRRQSASSPVSCSLVQWKGGTETPHYLNSFISFLFYTEKIELKWYKFNSYAICFHCKCGIQIRSLVWGGSFLLDMRTKILSFTDESS